METAHQYSDAEAALGQLVKKILYSACRSRDLSLQAYVFTKRAKKDTIQLPVTGLH